MRNLLVISLFLVLVLNGFGQESDELFFDRLESVDTLWFTIDYDCGATVNLLGNEEQYVLYKNKNKYTLMHPMKPIGSKEQIYNLKILKEKQVIFIRNLEVKSRDKNTKFTHSINWVWHYKGEEFNAGVDIEHRKKLEKIFK